MDKEYIDIKDVDFNNLENYKDKTIVARGGRGHGMNVIIPTLLDMIKIQLEQDTSCKIDSNGNIAELTLGGNLK